VKKRKRKNIKSGSKSLSIDQSKIIEFVETLSPPVPVSAGQATLLNSLPPESLAFQGGEEVRSARV
jgi:hypothetical protein